MKYKNISHGFSRSVGIKEKNPNQKYVNGSITIFLAYLSMNWCIGFNLYVLSNLSVYIAQQKLMDSNNFRKMVCLSLSKETEATILKQNNMRNIPPIQYMPPFESTYTAILTDTQNFPDNVEKEELDSLLNDIAMVEDGITMDRQPKKKKLPKNIDRDQVEEVTIQEIDADDAEEKKKYKKNYD